MCLIHNASKQLMLPSQAICFSLCWPPIKVMRCAIIMDNTEYWHSHYPELCPLDIKASPLTACKICLVLLSGKKEIYLIESLTWLIFMFSFWKILKGVMLWTGQQQSRVIMIAQWGSGNQIEIELWRSVLHFHATSCHYHHQGVRWATINF